MCDNMVINDSLPEKLIITYSSLILKILSQIYAKLLNINALFSVSSFMNIDNCNLITKELIKAHFIDNSLQSSRQI